MGPLIAQLRCALERLDSIYRSRQDVGSSKLPDAGSFEDIMRSTATGKGLIAVASLLESKIDSTMEESASRKSISVHVAKVLPLVKLVTDIGGLAAQVTLELRFLKELGGWLCSGYGRSTWRILNDGGYPFPDLLI